MPRGREPDSVKDIQSGAEKPRLRVALLFSTEARARQFFEIFPENARKLSVDTEWFEVIYVYKRNLRDELAFLSHKSPLSCLLDPDIAGSRIHAAVGGVRRIAGYLFSIDEAIGDSRSLSILGHRATLRHEIDVGWSVLIEDGYGQISVKGGTGRDAVQAAEERVRQVDARKRS
ncbi:MAG: hypothetical protein E6J90_12510 [Deltaproteobacteria bacterium]|nr:MAG: hypothetical protein E6J91_44990 [Deltaproteobacteria bacterium]TMQ22447.1 MAG: hypothetical protein E6J90_12510 [Deltaproteobacteria bacterium]